MTTMEENEFHIVVIHSVVVGAEARRQIPRREPWSLENTHVVAATAHDGAPAQRAAQRGASVLLVTLRSETYTPKRVNEHGIALCGSKPINFEIRCANDRIIPHKLVNSDESR